MMNNYTTLDKGATFDYEKTHKLMNCFLAYDYVKFNQMMKASGKNSGFMDNNSKDFLRNKRKLKNLSCPQNNREFNFNNRIFIRRKGKRSFKAKRNKISNEISAVYNSNTNSNTNTIDKNHNNIFMNCTEFTNNIQEDIKEIKISQKETENKLDRILKHLKRDSKEVIYEEVKNEINSINTIKTQTHDKNDLVNYNFSTDNFGFECLSQKQIFDYFSFKIKPDMSISSLNANEIKTDERTSLNSLNRKKMCHSPDRLIAHKFFEDTDQFRNTNLMSVKTFMNNNSESNPFCMTNKSDTEVVNINKQTLESIFRSDKRIDEEVESALDLTKNSNYDISISIDNFSQREIQSDKVKKRKVSNSDRSNHNHIHKFQISEEENNSNNSSNYLCNVTSSVQIPTKKGKNGNLVNTFSSDQNKDTVSENNDTASMSSSKILLETSQSGEKFKKVRGFNFKNNINTKKYNRPLISSMSTETPIKSNHDIIISDSNKMSESSNAFSHLTHTNSSNTVTSVTKSMSNFEEKIKKKFNFNNNINIKKFMRHETNGLFNVSLGNHATSNFLLKERERQYAVEIEEVESEPISINDLEVKGE